MAGHSKWANIKHRKAKQDASRGKVFTKYIREIVTAARLGGPDAASNPRLRAVVEKALSVNMTRDTINRAIQRGAGGEDNDDLKEVTYEGYGVGGVAVIVETMTDNRNRTAGEIRHLFSKHGGNLGESGCVSWMFDRKGFLSLLKEDIKMNEDELLAVALEVGAENMEIEDGSCEIYTQPENLDIAFKGLESKGIRVSEAEIVMIPKTTVKLSGEEAEKMMKLLDALEEHDDVNEVYSNFESLI